MYSVLMHLKKKKRQNKKTLTTIYMMNRDLEVPKNCLILLIIFKDQ